MDPYARGAFLAEACAGDDALRRDVESLLALELAAEHDRLDRPVAVKVIRPDALADTHSRERFHREARAAARVSHPHICPLYEMDEVDGRPFLVMELLEGETLAARLERGPLALTDMLAIATPMLEALAALHRRGIVHRDLKPANVFLTPEGLKLVDFGLAQPLNDEDQTREVRLTGQGTIVGTPQVHGTRAAVQGRSRRARRRLLGRHRHLRDAGRAAGICRADARRSGARRGISGSASDRWTGRSGGGRTCADEGAPQELLRSDRSRRGARGDAQGRGRESGVPAVEARPRLARFVALPLRVLKPDPETDFLAFSIPDAVSVALATLASVIVRSPQAAWTGANMDVRTIGRDLSVDVVLTGTILRAGQRVRVSAQLLDAEAGTLIWSDVAQAPIEDLFQLQDALTDRIVASLALPLSRRDRQSLARQAPSSAEAYELYLRANQLMTNPEHWTQACSLYERAIALDPGYALAWARLGRARRLLAKYGGPDAVGLDEAEEALRRALELNPDLSIAHDLSAYVEAELGRAPEAMERLLHRVAIRRHDPELLAGLVTTCRYAGLPEASLKAHERAVAIDPQMRTSVTWSYLQLGDYRAPSRQIGSPPFSALVAGAVGGWRQPAGHPRVPHWRPPPFPEPVSSAPRTLPLSRARWQSASIAWRSCAHRLQRSRGLVCVRVLAGADRCGRPCHRVSDTSSRRRVRLSRAADAPAGLGSPPWRSTLRATR